MPEVVLKIRVDKTSAVTDVRAFQAQMAAAFKDLGAKGLTGPAVSGGLSAGVTTEMAKATRAVTVSIDQQKAAQFRGRQLMLEDYKRYLAQEIAAEGDYNRRAIALGDALLRVQKQQAAEAARHQKQARQFDARDAQETTRRQRQAVQDENRQHRDEGYAIRTDQIEAARSSHAGESRAEGRASLAGQAGTGLMLAGGAVIGGLALATQQAADFDAKMVEVRNNTQMTDAEFDAMRAHVLSVGSQTGASMEEMGQAFMRAKNHSFDLADSLKIVDAATKSALATGSDIGETANVLSQTMHIFRLSGDQAAAAMNTLHMASLQGNTTMTELVQNFGLAEAVTSKYGLTLQDTSAVFATMTENGLNAAESGTQIRDVLQHLTNASPKATAEIKRLSKATGIDLAGDIKALREGTGSLSKTMIDLSAATGGQAVEINKIIPAQRGAFGAMALSGKAAVDLKRNYDQLADTMAGKIDPTTDGFLRQQQTLSAQQMRLANDTKALGVTIGDDLTPMVREGADALGGMVRAFNELAPANQRLIVGGTLLVGVLALVGGGALTAASNIASLMADLKTAGIAFGGMTAAAEGAATAEGAVAAEGASAFAAAGPWGLAIAAAVVLIGGIVIAWNQAKDAQDKYAKSKIDAANAVNTPDTRTNISAQAAQNTAEADRQQKLLDQLLSTPNGTMRPRDPSQGRYEDTVGATPTSGRGGMSLKQVDALRAQQIAMLTRNIAALRADATTLTSDGGATSDYGNAKRNFQREVEKATQSQAQIAARIKYLDAQIAATQGSGTKVSSVRGKLSDERAQQQANYDALERDKQKNQKSAAYLGTLETKDRARNGGAGTGEDAGMAIAKAAYAKYKNGVAAGYVHLCEGLAHDNYKGIGGLYKQILEGGGAHNSAKKTLARFQKANLAQPYTPGMALPPGSLLYSSTMGEGSGHVQTIGPRGERLDQYGVNHFNEKNFQYYVPPPSGKIGDKPAAGAPPPPGDAGGTDKAAQDRAQAMVEAAGLDVDKAAAAFDHCKSEFARTGNQSFLVLAKAARAKVRQAQMKKAMAALSKAKAEGAKNGTTSQTAEVQFQAAKFAADTSYTGDIQGLNDQISGSPKERANTAFDVAIGRKEAQLAAVKAQIEHYSRALDKGNDPQVVAALENSYRAEKKLEDDKAGLEYKKASSSSPLDNRVLRQKEGLAVAASQQALDRNLLDLAQKRLDAFTRMLDVQREQRQGQSRLLDAQLAAPGVTDAQGRELRGQKYGLDLAEIGDQYTRDRASLSPDTKAGALGKFQAALAALNTEYSSGTTENANEALRRHADLLRTQAGATDDLTEKMRLLTQYFDTLAGVAGQTPEQAAALGIERKTTLGDLQRETSARDGQVEIGSGLKAHDQSQIELGLSVLGMLAATGTRTQQESGRAEYLDAVKGLGVSGALPADDALLRVQGVRDAAQTPAEIAAATDAARQILDKIIKDDLHSDTDPKKNIDEMKSPSARRKAIQDEIAKISKMPDVLPAVKAEATTGLTKDLNANKNRDVFAGLWTGLQEDAGREGGDIVRALLNPKDRKNIGKQFWGWLASTGENALGSVASSSIQNAISGGMKGMNGKNLFGDVEGLFKGAKGSMLEGAAGIYGAAMALGAGGKKKQKHSIFGAVLGGIAGSFLGNPMGGMEIGSALGGMFAEGGRPPVGKISVIGERGRELFVPDSAGTIIPNHGIESFMRSAATPQFRLPAITASRAAVASAPVTGDTDASITIHQNGDHHYHSQVDLDSSNRNLAKLLERARRGGVPAS